MRHLNGNKEDLRRANLALGTARDNAYDKPAAVRLRTRQIARAAQGIRGATAQLSDDATARLQAWARAQGWLRPEGRVAYGAVRRIARRLGLTESAVRRALRASVPPELASRPDLTPPEVGKRAG